MHAVEPGPGAAGLRRPCVAAIAGGEDRPVHADRPAALAVSGEVHAGEQVSGATGLRRPRVATVAGGEDCSVLANRPAQTLGSEEHRVQVGVVGTRPGRRRHCFRRLGIGLRDHGARRGRDWRDFIRERLRRRRCGLGTAVRYAPGIDDLCRRIGCHLRQRWRIQLLLRGKVGRCLLFRIRLFSGQRFGKRRPGAGSRLPATVRRVRHGSGPLLHPVAATIRAVQDKTAIADGPDILRVRQNEDGRQTADDDTALEGVALERIRPPVCLADVPVGDRPKHVRVRRLALREKSGDGQQSDDQGDQRPAQPARHSQTASGFLHPAVGLERRRVLANLRRLFLACRRNAQACLRE